MGFFSRQPKPDLEALARAFGAMVDVVTEWQKTKLDESVMVRDSLSAMHYAMGLPEPPRDRQYDFLALFAANRPRFRSVEMALLTSLNLFLGNRDLTQEDVATIIRESGRYENKGETEGT